MTSSIPQDNNADQVEIDKVVNTFYSIFTNKNGLPKLEMLRHCCIDRIVIAKNSDGVTELYDLEMFLMPRKDILTNGRLTDFEEIELSASTLIKENIAQRISEYKKEGILDGVRFSNTGTKMFQFLKINHTWKIFSFIWYDHTK